MEVSTPIPVKSDTTALQETSAKTNSNKPLKNDRLGGFAKILDGLIQKTKRGDSSEGTLLTKLRAAKKENSLLANIAGIKEKAQQVEEKIARIKKKGEEINTSETLALLTPQEIKTKAENPQKVKNPSDNILAKERKEENSAQTIVSDVKAKEVIDAEIKTAQVSLKTNEEELKLSKHKENSEKEDRKIAVSSSNREERQALQNVPDTHNLNHSQENSSNKNVAEARGRDRKRETKIDVQDLRTREPMQQENIFQAKAEIKSVEAKTADLTVDLSSGGRSREAVLRSADQRPAVAFEDFLARELHQNLNGDIVRHAQIILKDNSAGLIRLSLRPETLGNVKIQLEMSENKITGHIIVESSEALKAFEREIKSLEQAFRDSGFEGAQLDMALSSGNEGSNQEQNGEKMFSYSEKLAAENYDNIVDTNSVFYYEGAEAPQVNVLV